MSDRMTKEEHANVLAALETCKTGGYRDIDGDWCKRQVFDEPAVAEAIAIIRKEPEPISDAEIERIIDAMPAYTGRFEVACVRAVLAAIGGATP